MDPKKPGISLKNVFTSHIKLSEEAKTEMLEQTRRFVAFFTEHACNNATCRTKTTIPHSDVVNAFIGNTFVFQHKVNAPFVFQQPQEVSQVVPLLLMDQPSSELDFDCNQETTPQYAPGSSSMAVPPPQKRKRSQLEIIHDIEELKEKVQRLERNESERIIEEKKYKIKLAEAMEWLTSQVRDRRDIYKQEIDELKQLIATITAQLQGNAG